MYEIFTHTTKMTKTPNVGKYFIHYGMETLCQNEVHVERCSLKIELHMAQQQARVVSCSLVFLSYAVHSWNPFVCARMRSTPKTGPPCVDDLWWNVFFMVYLSRIDLPDHMLFATVNPVLA